MRAKRYEAAGINIPKEDPKEKPKTARHSFVQCPECKKELVYPHDATVGVCSRCSAPFSINENGTEYLHLSPIKQPESIPNFNKWIAEIEALTNEELLKRYLEEDEWQEEYRYLCYTELMSRLNIN